MCHYCAHLFLTQPITNTCGDLLHMDLLRYFKSKSHDGSLPNPTQSPSMHLYSITSHPMHKPLCKLQSPDSLSHDCSVKR